jgi:hypothetical protein
MSTTGGVTGMVDLGPSQVMPLFCGVNQIDNATERWHKGSSNDGDAPMTTGTKLHYRGNFGNEGGFATVTGLRGELLVLSFDDGREMLVPDFVIKADRSGVWKVL